MASGNWTDSTRRRRLPPDWPARRARILKRDGGQCTHRDDYGARCPSPATDVDHIRPGDDHRESNLTSLCGYHHDKKSSREGGMARAAERARIDAMFRRPKTHPSDWLD